MKTRATSLQANLSALSIGATVILASITHAYEYGMGYRAWVAGTVALSLLFLLNVAYRRAGGRMLLFAYGILNAGVILGSGIGSGLWNHALKIFLWYLHNGRLPPLLAHLFPPVACAPLEAVGALTFVTSMFAAHHLHQMVQQNVKG